MSELSHEARAVIDAARGADEPGAGDHDRVRGKLLAAIAAGAGASAAAGAGSAQASTAAAAVGGAGVVKLAIAALIAGAVAIGGYVALRGGDDGAARAKDAPVERVAVPTITPRVDPQPAPVTPEVPSVEPPAAAPDVEPDAPVAKQPAPSAPRKRPAAPALSAADSLRAERELLAKASAALRDGDAAAALAATREHARRFPSGVMLEERAAIGVQALCATGGADTAKARDQFLARYPRSVHAARVRAACD